MELERENKFTTAKAPFVDLIFMPDDPETTAETSTDVTVEAARSSFASQEVTTSAAITQGIKTSSETFGAVSTALNETFTAGVANITESLKESLSPGLHVTQIINATVLGVTTSQINLSDLGNATVGVLLSTVETNVSTSAGSARAEDLSATLWQWMAPFIFFLGFFGNIAILVVLKSRPVMSDTTTSTYVFCLAIADLLSVIFGMIPEWFAFMDIFNFEEVHPVSCKFYKFLAYTASDASIWILVAFTVERFIAVVFPFKRQKGWCNVSQVKMICVSMVGLGVVKNLQFFWTRGAEFQPIGVNGTLSLRSNCGYPTPADRYFNFYIRPYLVLITVDVVPMTILWVCNFTVIRTIYKRSTIQRLQLRVSAAHARASAITQQVTIMCLCASFSFIAFMTPSMVLFCGKAYWQNSEVSRGSYIIAKAVNNQLLYINNSINFYLYLFSGQRFRQATIMIFCRCRKWRDPKSDRSMRLEASATSTRVRRTDVATFSNAAQLKPCNGQDGPS